MSVVLKDVGHARSPIAAQAPPMPTNATAAVAFSTTSDLGSPAIAAKMWGPTLPIVGGMLLMSAGLTALAVITPSASAWLLADLIIPVGIGGPVRA